jgi:hypothetical protein
MILIRCGTFPAYPRKHRPFKRESLLGHLTRLSLPSGKKRTALRYLTAFLSFGYTPEVECLTGREGGEPARTRRNRFFGGFLHHSLSRRAWFKNNGHHGPFLKKAIEPRINSEPKEPLNKRPLFESPLLPLFFHHRGKWRCFTRRRLFRYYWPCALSWESVRSVGRKERSHRIFPSYCRPQESVED